MNYFHPEIVKTEIMKVLQKDVSKLIAVFRYRELYYYGFLLFAALFLLKLSEQRFMLAQRSYEIFGGAIALIFLLIGIWVSKQFFTANESLPSVNVNEQDAVSPSEADGLIASSAQFISEREKEILVLIAGGMSNQEIADRLFISLSTVKTHNQNLFTKLEVKRRTQAVEKAKRLKIID